MANAKILLVDDVQLFLEMQKDLFRRESYILLTANGGWEALDIMAREKPDLVFMDLFMPQGRGDEACARAKADPALRGIPIVIVTNSKDAKELSACRLSGCQEILFKPIDRDRFLATASRLLPGNTADSARVKLRIPVRFGQNQTSWTQAWAFNLSASGVFVETEHIPSVGQEIHVEITLPTLEITLSGKARVAWSNLPGTPSRKDYPMGAGLQFVDFSESQQKTLQVFLRRFRTGGIASPGKIDSHLPLSEGKPFYDSQ